MQSPDYTRAMLRGTLGLDETSIERSVEARARRQELLARERPPELFFIVAEAAVRQQVGGSPMVQEAIHRFWDLERRALDHAGTLSVIEGLAGC